MANLIKGLLKSWRSTRVNEERIDSLLRKAYEWQMAGRYAEAEQGYSQVLQINHNHIDAQYLLGRLNGKQGNYSQAEVYLRGAIKLKPDFIEAYTDLGNVLQLSGRNEEAKDCYLKALNFKSDNILAINNLGLLLVDMQQWAEAGSYFERAILLQPGFPGAIKNFVHVYRKAEQLIKVLPVLNKVIETNPECTEAYAGLGFAYLKTFKPIQALPFFRHLLDLNPNDAEAQGNMAMALQDLGKLDQAVDAYDKALELNPQNETVRWHRSLALLLMGEFKKAWPDYELRLLSKQTPQRNFPYPRWDGSGIKDKTILVYAEQGIGDEMMFASCIPDLIAKAKHCIIDCNLKLAPIFTRSFPLATVHGGTQFDDIAWLNHVPKIDVQVPIGSLPLYFRNSLNNFPRHSGYLKADGNKEKYWKEKIDNLGAGLKVGFSWRGGTRISRREVRSLSINDCLPILRQSGIHLINLQYDYDEIELLKFNDEYGIKIHNWPEAIEDYVETAALVSSLDLVISVCTAVIHLGGALGKPVWIMAPATPEWRYMQYSETLPWYPSVKVFRQIELGNWESVTQRVSKELSSLTFK